MGQMPGGNQDAPYSRSQSLAHAPQQAGNTTRLPQTERSVTTVETSQAAADNPFVLPRDEDIFRLREEERAARAAEKAAAAGLSVRDKTTFACRMQQTFGSDAIKQAFKETFTLAAVRPGRAGAGAGGGTLGGGGGGGGGAFGGGAAGGDDADGGAGGGGGGFAGMTGATLAAAAVAAAACPARGRPARENLHEFLAKKRQIFLVQMSLDTKRAEIRKLEERARQRAEALSKSEAMLDEDTVRFDAFLKENDEKVQEAIRRAEAEAKAKADRVAEIKRLNGAIAALRSELGKKEEALADCGRYQEFLDSVTPKEHFESRKAAKAERRAARLAAWQAACAAVQARRDKAALAKSRAEVAFSNARTQQEAERAERAVKDAAAELKEAARCKEPPRPDLDALEAADDAQEESMYFRDPRQLLEVFTQLEEDNLFLIQNCQEAEEQLEEVRGRHWSVQARMESEVGAVQGQIAKLEARVEAARARAERLRERAAQGDAGVPRLALGSGGREEGPTLEALGNKVAEVYARCGFEPDASLTMLQMLTSMEVRLHESLAQVEALPADWVADVEKSREKERRQVAREEKLRSQTEEHESRVRRALERAAAPVYRKAGKPAMLRSALPRRRVVQERSAMDDEEEELAAFLARELL